jgi:hypothetical protein
MGIKKEIKEDKRSSMPNVFTCERTIGSIFPSVKRYLPLTPKNYLL